MIFKFAVDKINSDASLFPSSTLTPVIERIAKNDSYHTDKKGLYTCGSIACLVSL